MSSQPLKIICVMCQEALIGETSLELTVSSDCGHAFHTTCVKELARINNVSYEHGRVNCPNCDEYFLLRLALRLCLTTKEDTENSEEKEQLVAKLEATTKELVKVKEEKSLLETSYKELRAGTSFLKLKRKSLARAVTSANNNVGDSESFALSVSSAMNVSARVRSRRADAEDNQSSARMLPPTVKKPKARKALKENQPAAATSSQTAVVEGPTKYNGPLTRSRSKIVVKV